MNSIKIFGPFKEVITLQNLPLNGALSDDKISIISQGGIVVEDGLIHDFGDYEQLVDTYESAERILLENPDYIVVPSFIDCHTHICWAGSRTNDYALRVAGKSYLDVAASGGGIMSTVKATREASEEELIESILIHANELLKQGIGIIEVKSGYGLNYKDELKMLRAIKNANLKTPVELIPTFLGAHIKPKDFNGSNSEYLNMLLTETVPIIQAENLASRADIFVEEGAFSINEAREYANKLKDLGFEMTMHVDQFHSSGGQLAVEIGCVSGDHLECIDKESIRHFSNSDTVAVALPGASIGLGMKFTPCRELLDQGACVAIASDWNPGSAPMGNLLAQAAILGASEKLSIAETLAGISYRAAQALRINAGKIEKGSPAKFNIFKTDDYRNIFYQQGSLRPKYTVLDNEFIKH